MFEARLCWQQHTSSQEGRLLGCQSVKGSAAATLFVAAPDLVARKLVPDLVWCGLVNTSSVLYSSCIHCGVGLVWGVRVDAQLQACIARAIAGCM